MQMFYMLSSNDDNIITGICGERVRVFCSKTRSRIESVLLNKLQRCILNTHMNRQKLSDKWVCQTSRTCTKMQFSVCVFWYSTEPALTSAPCARSSSKRLNGRWTLCKCEHHSLIHAMKLLSDPLKSCYGLICRRNFSIKKSYLRIIISGSECFRNRDGC